MTSSKLVMASRCPASNMTAKAACQQTEARVEGHVELLAETMQTALQFRKAALAVSRDGLKPAVMSVCRAAGDSQYQHRRHGRRTGRRPLGAGFAQTRHIGRWQ
ncbi:MAG: hypothetical protein P8010_16415 [Desulfosarcinaceae bacterium]